MLHRIAGVVGEANALMQKSPGTLPNARLVVDKREWYPLTGRQVLDCQPDDFVAIEYFWRRDSEYADPQVFQSGRQL